MIGAGREDKADNDLFYTCSLIEYIARKTKNLRSDVVAKLGRDRLDRIYNLADVYHCDNIDRVIDDYNSSVYYENPSYIYESYKNGELL